MTDETKTGWSASITQDERDLINTLLELEGRSGPKQLMWMVKRRLAELEVGK